VSSFLTAHQHIIGYSVPYNGLENVIKDGKYNQGYLAQHQGQIITSQFGEQMLKLFDGRILGVGS